MTADELAALIAEGESLSLEFKRDAPISHKDLVETVVCLANTEGGTVLIGVEDDGTISGVHPNMPNARGLEALVANRTIPGVRVRAEFVQVEALSVAVLTVGRSAHLVQTSDGRMMSRFMVGKGEPECRALDPSEIVSRLSYIGQFDYSARTLPEATWDDLDPIEFERIKQLVDDSARSDKSLQGLPNETLAQALGLVKRESGRNVPTIAGVLIAGRKEAIRNFVPTHEIAFQVMGQDLEVTFNEFYREPLVRAFMRFEELLMARNSEEEFDFGIQRIGVPLYPMHVFREALANALTHRDYALHNAIYVRLDPRAGGLVMTNPGGFVNGVTLENLLVSGPRPRNPTLADAFKRLGLVERTGRGVERIFEGILSVGRRAPNYGDTSSSQVSVVLPGGKADLDFVRLTIEIQNRLQQRLDWRYLLVLRQTADEGELSVSETANLIQRDKTDARVVLEHMVELGLLEAKGTPRSRSYHLSASVFKRLGRRAAYVRRRGVDHIQQEQMILQYLDKFGEISREDVQELLPHLNRNQTSYLLRKMAKNGVLDAFGEKRGRTYRKSKQP